MTGQLHGFHQQLERVRLRTMLAVERASAKPDPEVLERLGRQLTGLEAVLAELRDAARDQLLAFRLGLDDTDLELMWTAVAVAADPRLVPHLQVLGGQDARRGISLWLHAQIWQLEDERPRELAQRLAGGHPLIRDHLLVWTGEPGTANRTLVAASRTVTWLAGSEELDETMCGAGTVVAVPAQLALDPRQEASAANLPGVLLGTPSPLVIVEGASGTGRRTAIASVAAKLGKPVIALDVRRLPAGPAALELALVGLRRECRLRDAIPLVLDLHELITAEGTSESLRILARVVDAMPGPFAATASQRSLDLPVARPIVRVRWQVPDTATRRAMWVRALGADAAAIETELDDISIRYGLGAGGIARAVISARLVAGTSPLTSRHVVEGVRSNIAEALGDLAVRQEVSQTWDDLVLAPDIQDQITMLVSRVKHAHRVLEDWGFSSKLPKGAGVAALFSGPPGTGKTMVAGLIARQLDLELYQVDLSKVVSKWVGETEKQLAKIFEAAEAGHALLLFDEADSLFAKRTEVKSATDRYANLEVNYLLQRIESFGGVSILTTNLETSIDPALRRRLAASVAFWPPEESERQKLWRRMLVSRAPIDADLDLDELAAAFDEMTGANIRNAALSAAFLAAAEQSPITQKLLERAARAEYASMGRVLGRK
ncbi:MAG: AAA family ATPase [Kofleriaceae bacterium]